METKSEWGIERFHLPYNIRISKGHWWDLVACIYVCEAGRDGKAWVFFPNCQNQLPWQAEKVYTELTMQSAISPLLNYWCVILPVLKAVCKRRMRDTLHKKN